VGRITGSSTFKIRTPSEDSKRVIGDITKLIPADVSSKLQATAETTRIESKLVAIEFRQERLFPTFRGEVEMIAILH